MVNKIVEGCGGGDIQPSFRRKTDIFYGNPGDLLAAARNGGITIQELRDFLIYIKKPKSLEKKIIQETENAELLVVKILEQTSEIIDYNESEVARRVNEQKVYADNGPEKYIQKYEQLKITIDDLYTHDVMEVVPHLLDVDDIVLIQLMYKKENETTPIELLLSVSRIYSSKIKGEGYIKGPEGDGCIFCGEYSLPITEVIYQDGRRPIDIFKREILATIREDIRLGLRERFITKIQIFSKQQKGFTKTSIFDRIFQRKK